MFKIDKTQATLTKIVDEIHDLLFDIDSVEYRKESQSLIIHLGHLRRLKMFSKRCFRKLKTLTINGAVKYEINDTEKVGYYDINTLKFDNNKLYIITEIPLHFVVNLEEGFEISVKSTKP